MTLRTPALACDAEKGCAPLRAVDVSTLPPGVLADARRLAGEEYGRDKAKATELAAQMAALYLKAQGNDVLIIFNPGGWGWAAVEKMPLWASILKGMKETLINAGRKAAVVNYVRTARGPGGCISEFLALSNLSRAKGRELAVQAEFLTRHLPAVKVIIAGESNGAAMAEDAMDFLRNNPRVFSVQTGTPFWAPSLPFERSLIINHNGVEPDAFSTGDVRRWISANVQALFGRYKGSRGNVLLYIGAPGHVYNWDYPAVREKIIRFLTGTVAASKQ